MNQSHDDELIPPFLGETKEELARRIMENNPGRCIFCHTRLHAIDILDYICNECLSKKEKGELP